MRPGPGSIAWRVNGERLAVLGWGRAILLQLAHPLVAAGVVEHSSFRGGPLATVTRFHATLRAMLSLTFGDEQDAAATVRRIRGIHDRVNGTLAGHAGVWPAGTPYSAHDPALLAWVNLTLLDSVPLVYDQFVAPLSADEIGAYATQSRWAAELIGVRPADVPGSEPDLRASMERVLASGVLVVTPASHALAHAVMYPPLGRMTGPVGRLHVLSALGWLPPAVREAYGFRWTAADASALERWCRRLRAWSARAPSMVRRWSKARRAERNVPGTLRPVP